MTDTIYDNSTELDPRIAARLKRDAKGLVAAVVQQYDTHEVLMVGYMNDEALRRTLTTGRVTFWSRSRQEYWRKGDTSGHVQSSRVCPWTATAMHCWLRSIRSVPPATPASAVASSKEALCPWSKVIVRSSSRVGSFLWLPSLRLNREENAEAFLGEGERQ